jgi:EF hand
LNLEIASMRAKSLVGIVFVAALATGCADDGDAAAKAAARNTIMEYVPPSITSRADFGGLVERRFQRLDVNHDGELTQDELPPRFTSETIARQDSDKDGKLDSGEWGKMMLDRFDRQDANKDGTVTTQERQAFRAPRKADGTQP